MKPFSVVLALAVGIGGVGLTRSDDPQAVVHMIGCRITSRTVASRDILSATVTGNSLEGAVAQLYRAYTAAARDRERECLLKPQRQAAPLVLRR